MENYHKVIICIAMIFTSCVNDAKSQLPQDHEYQVVLRNYLDTLTEEDFVVSLQKLTVEESYFNNEDEIFRAWLLFGYDQYEMPSSIGFRVAPEHFTLGSIESGGEVNMSTGRNGFINAEETIFWAKWNYEGNPHYGSRAVIMRAFVAAAVDMMMEDRLIENGNNRRSDFLGGNLIWWSLAYGTAKEYLPEEVKIAYESALIKMFERIETWGPRGTHADMDTRALISMQYVAKYVESENLQNRAFAYIDRVLDRHLKAPGYIDHGDTYDADYNGISLYYINWAARINEYPRLVEAIDKMSKLKAYMTLPDPDNNWYSPHHSNPSSEKGAANDSWSKYFRNISATEFSNYATYLINRETSNHGDPGLHTAEEMISQMRRMLRNANTGTRSFDNGFALVSNRNPQTWRHDHWTNSEFNYTSLYYSDGLYNTLKDRSEIDLHPPFSRHSNFVESFDDKILSIKRNGYGAIIFNDRLSWWTREGSTRGLHGIGGGNLSAFWTPETGTVIMGIVRMPRNGGINFDEWETWPVHSLSGETDDGNSFSSGAQRFPESQYDLDNLDGPKVTVQGDLSNIFSNPTQSINQEFRYEREFRMYDEGLEVTTRVIDNTPNHIESLFEIIPIYLKDLWWQRNRTPTKIEFYVNNSWQEATTTIVLTSKIRLSRFSGTVNITLNEERYIRLSSEDFDQRPSHDQRGRLIRNIMIDMLQTQGSGEQMPSVTYMISRGDAYQGGGNDDDDEEVPGDAELHLEQNYPNPFNPSTQIRFSVSNAQEVSLNVYDTAGRLVSKVFSGHVDADDERAITFDASGLASGIYFYKLITTNGVITKKMTYLK